MAHKILVRIEVDDEYKDVHPDIAASDYMEGSRAKRWEVVSEPVYTASEVRAMLEEIAFAGQSTISKIIDGAVPVPFGYRLDQIAAKHGITLDPA